MTGIAMLAADAMSVTFVLERIVLRQTFGNLQVAL